MSKIKFNLVDLIGFFALCFTLFFLIKTSYSSSVILLAQAENYGDIKLEIRDQSNLIVEEQHFLVNTEHYIYSKTYYSDLAGKKLQFYPDRRHKVFASKGIIVIEPNLAFHWISPAVISDNNATWNIKNSHSTTFTSIYSGFGENAHIKIALKQTSLKNFIAPFVFIVFTAVFFIIIGKLIISLINNVKILEKHKLRLFAISLLVLIFSPLHSLTIVLFAIFLVYCFSLELVLSKPYILKNHKNFITVALFSIIFVGFATQAKLLKGIKDEIHSQEESSDLGIFDKFGKRFSDLFVYKKEIGHLNSLLKVDLFERSPTSKVIIGKDGMMFEGTGERRIEGDNIAFFDNVSDYLGRLPFEDGELTQWENSVQQRHCWLRNQNIDYVFAIAPTKALVYPEYLPKNLATIKSKLNKQPRIELLEKHLKKNNQLPIINLTHALVAAKALQDYPKLFYRTDFHWNYLGAYYAYEAIINQISSIYPNKKLAPIELNKFDLDINPNWAHKTFLSLLGLLPQWYNNEHYIKLMPKADNPISSMQPYGAQGVFDIKIPRKKIETKSGKNYTVEYIENPIGKTKKILVLGDSFIQKVFPLISAHGQENYFSRAVFHFPEQLIETIKPDIVIQEILNMYLLRKPPTNSKIVRNAVCN